MDKIVRRITVVEAGGSHERSGSYRRAKVVYNSVDDNDDDEPDLHPLERRVRRLLKAHIIHAQEAYQEHLNSVAKGGSAWIYDSPRNLLRARRKALRELNKSGPFKDPEEYNEDEED